MPTGVYVRTEETKRRLSVAHMGYITSSETRAKKSAANMGHVVSPETRAKMSAARKGRHWKGTYWRGGPVVWRRKGNAKRRVLGFIPLNTWFAGCEGHHVDNKRVIFIPKELHRSIYHRQPDGRGMVQMNAVAYNFLFKQQVELAIVGA